MQHSAESSYPLSPMQEGMLFHSLRGPRSGVDIEQMVVGLPEPLDVPKLQAAWESVVQRHAALRVGFRWEGLTTPIQVVEPLARLPFQEHDWRALSLAQRDVQFRYFLGEDRRRGFTMDHAPLFRLTLFRFGETDYHLVWTLHHALLDGRSFPLVLQEVFLFYQAYPVGGEPELPPRRPYRDYIDWLQTQNHASAETYWRNLLKGYRGGRSGMGGRPPSPPDGEAAPEGDRETRLSAGVTTSLARLAEEAGLTLNTLVQGAWALLLSRYSGETDVVFGATRACRHSSIEGVEAMIGLFVNTLPVRVRAEPDAALLPWLKELRGQWVAMRDYEHTPLVKVQRWSEVPPGQPLFESILVFEKFSLEARLKALGSDWVRRKVVLYEKTNYPLTLAACAGPELVLQVGYHQDRYEDATAQRLLEHVKTLLEGMLARPTRLAELPMLTVDERRQLLVEWNQTPVDYPRDQCLHELFEVQVARAPDAVAVMFQDQQLTYRELDERANQLARHLSALGVGPEVFVGLCGVRGWQMVAGLLAVLKAGGAYVPLDPQYPQERSSFMLHDTQAPVVLTQRELVPRLPPIGGLVVCLDEFGWISTRDRAERNATEAQPSNLAYLIYTSGSTGQPKGVMVPLRALVNHSTAIARKFSLTRNDRVLQFASLSFDVAAEELFPSLISGATVVLPPGDGRQSLADFESLLAGAQVTVVNLPTSFWQEWVAALSAGDARVPPSLRLVVVGSESASVARLQDWQDRVSASVGWLNAYGPTETTITTTVYQPHNGWQRLAGPTVPIGRPIANSQVYILDEALEPVPRGAPGELYIGGEGLARGYLRRPELTAEKFIPNPFKREPGARLYRTGDLARFLRDGNLEFLGRRDQQVKLRGFRIELGEIEAVLAQHPTVQMALVALSESSGGQKRLIAYVVPHSILTQPADGRTPLDLPELRGFLRARLPAYMIPASFTVLDSLPLLPNGKVDRRALPAPVVTDEPAPSAFVAPQTPAEVRLAHIWSAVLGVKQIGAHDNFFELGGHSLLATQIMSRIRRTLGVSLPLQSIFEAPTVAALAERIETARRAEQHHRTRSAGAAEPREWGEI